jgi:hypothetical protein
MPPEGLQLRESLLLLIDLTEGPLASVRSLLRANLRDARQRGSCPSGLRRGLFQIFRLSDLSIRTFRCIITTWRGGVSLPDLLHYSFTRIVNTTVFLKTIRSSMIIKTTFQPQG